MSSGERKSRTQIVAYSQNCDQLNISALTNIYFKEPTGESIWTIPRRGQLKQPSHYSVGFIKIKKSKKKIRKRKQ